MLISKYCFYWTQAWHVDTSSSVAVLNKRNAPELFESNQFSSSTCSFSLMINHLLCIKSFRSDLKSSSLTLFLFLLLFLLIELLLLFFLLIAMLKVTLICATMPPNYFPFSFEKNQTNQTLNSDFVQFCCSSKIPFNC